MRPTSSRLVQLTPTAGFISHNASLAPLIPYGTTNSGRTPHFPGDSPLMRLARRQDDNQPAYESPEDDLPDSAPYAEGDPGIRMNLAGLVRVGQRTQKGLVPLGRKPAAKGRTRPTALQAATAALPTLAELEDMDTAGEALTYLHDLNVLGPRAYDASMDALSRGDVSGALQTAVRGIESCARVSGLAGVGATEAPLTRILLDTLRTLGANTPAGQNVRRRLQRASADLGLDDGEDDEPRENTKMAKAEEAGADAADAEVGFVAANSAGKRLKRGSLDDLIDTDGLRSRI